MSVHEIGSLLSQASDAGSARSARSGAGSSGGSAAGSAGSSEFATKIDAAIQSVRRRPVERSYENANNALLGLLRTSPTLQGGACTHASKLRAKLLKVTEKFAFVSRDGPGWLGRLAGGSVPRVHNALAHAVRHAMPFLGGEELSECIRAGEVLTTQPGSDAAKTNPVCVAVVQATRDQRKASKRTGRYSPKSIM